MSFWFDNLSLTESDAIISLPEVTQHRFMELLLTNTIQYNIIVKQKHTYINYNNISTHKKYYNYNYHTTFDNVRSSSSHHLLSQEIKAFYFILYNFLSFSSTLASKY